MRYFSRILIKSIYKFIINRRIPYPWINRYSTNYYLLVFYKIPSIDIWAHVSHIWNRKSCMQRQYAHALCIRTHSSYDTSYNPHFLSYVTILAALAIHNRSRFSRYLGSVEKRRGRKGTCYELLLPVEVVVCLAPSFSFEGEGEKKSWRTVERVARFQAFPFPFPVSPLSESRCLTRV